MAETNNTITKVSEIDADYLASYLRIDDADETTTRELETMLSSAIGFVSSYVGLPASDAKNSDADDTNDVQTLDSNAEFVTAVVVLVQNQYDNRTFYTDKGKVEDCVNTILGMHRINLL